MIVLLIACGYENLNIVYQKQLQVAKHKDVPAVIRGGNVMMMILVI